MPPKRPPAARKKNASGRTNNNNNRDSSDAAGGRISSQASTMKRRIITCQEVAQVFQEAQLAPNVNSCTEKILKMFRDKDYEDVIYPVIECTLFALIQTPEESPHRKYVFNFLCKFLIKRCNLELEEQLTTEREGEETSSNEPSEPEEDAEANEEDVDEIAMLVGESKTARCQSKKPAVKKVKKQLTKDAAKKPKLTTVDRLLKEVAIQALAADAVTTKINACFFVSKILEEVNDIVTSVYNSLRKGLVDCLANKNPGVRAAAAKAFLRFQEVTQRNDVVTCAYKFHLHSDPDPRVRQAILMVVEPSKDTLEEIITRTRDVKDFVRKAAYVKLADRVHIQLLTIDQRLALLKEGLHDRSPAVRATVQKKLLIQWLKSSNDDIIQLLEKLDIESDTETIELMLNVLFKAYMSQKQGEKTKFHLFLDSFKFKHLDYRKLLLKCPLTVENTFLWRCLAKFCKEHNLAQLMANDASDLAEVKDQEPDSNAEREIDMMFARMQMNGEEVILPSTEAGPGPSEIDTTPVVTEGHVSPSKLGPTPPKKPKTTIEYEIDLVDLIIPQAGHMCRFFKHFCQTVDKKEFDEVQLSDYDFVCDQLIQILLLTEIADPAQKEILQNTVKEILFLPNLSTKLTNLVSPLMQVLVKSVFANSNHLLKFTCDLVQEIHNSVIEHVMEEEGNVTESEEGNENHDESINKKMVKEPKKVFTAADIRTIELNYAKVSVELEEVRDEIDQHVKDQNYMQAEELKHKKMTLESERQQLMRDRLEARGEVVDSDDEDDLPDSSKRESTSSRLEPEISDHPKELMKCLLLFTACLEAGDFRAYDSVIQTHLDKICFPGLVTEDPSIRQVAVKAIGLCCYTHISFAKRYFALLIQIIQHDVPSVRNNALSSLFDVMCQHGIQGIQDDRKSTADQDKSQNVVDGTVDGTGSITFGAAGDSVEGSQVADQKEEDEEETFLHNLCQLILEHMMSDSPDTRLVAVRGACKMLFLGRISSTVILTRLLLMWYNEDTTKEVKHFLGVWFPLFAFHDNQVRNSSSGQLAFEEAFLPTLETAFKMSPVNLHERVHEEDDDNHEKEPEVWEFEMNDKQMDNLISFMINLMSDPAQVTVAITVADRFYQLLQKKDMEKFQDKVLSKAMSILSLSSATRAQLKQLRLMANKIVDLMPTSQRKLSITRITKLREKVDSLLDQLPASQDSLINTSTSSRKLSLINQSGGNITVRELSQTMLTQAATEDLGLYDPVLPGEEEECQQEDQHGHEEDGDEETSEINYSVLSQDISSHL